MSVGDLAPRSAPPLPPPSSSSATTAATTRAATLGEFLQAFNPRSHVWEADASLLHAAASLFPEASAVLTDEWITKTTTDMRTDKAVIFTAVVVALILFSPAGKRSGAMVRGTASAAHGHLDATIFEAVRASLLSAGLITS